MSYTSVVIGANSFLGQEIISKELFLNHQVFGVYHKNKDKLLQNIAYHSLDQFLLLSKAVDVIYLVSAYVPDGNIDEENLFNVNVKLVKDLSDLFLKSRIVLASSVSVYEQSKNVITEKSSTSPNSTYGISKLWAEHVLRRHNNYSIVRISSMYGIGMKTNTFIPRVILSAINKSKIVLFGDGSRLQNYVHISHVAEVMVKSASITSNQIFLAVGKTSVSNKELADCVKRVSNHINVEYKGEDYSPSFVYNDDITREVLGVSDKVSLEDEIKNLWNWLKEF